MERVRQRRVAFERCRYCGHDALRNIDSVHHFCAE